MQCTHQFDWLMRVRRIEIIFTKISHKTWAFNIKCFFFNRFIVLFSIFWNGTSGNQINLLIVFFLQESNDTKSPYLIWDGSRFLLLPIPHCNRASNSKILNLLDRLHYECLCFHRKRQSTFSHWQFNEFTLVWNKKIQIKVFYFKLWLFLVEGNEIIHSNQPQLEKRHFKFKMDRFRSCVFPDISPELRLENPTENKHRKMLTRRWISATSCSGTTRK